MDSRQARAQLHAVASRLSALADRLERDAERDELDEAVAEIRHVQTSYFGPRPRAARGAGAKWKLLDVVRMSMPERAVHEDRDASRLPNQVGATRNPLV
jgi:hypothetical protein